MTKLQYVLSCPRGLDRGEFCSIVEHDLTPKLLDQGPAGLKLSLTEPGLCRPLFLPIRRKGLALVSVWLDDDADPAPWTTAATSLGFETAGYRVTESLPRAYDRDWPDGERTEGAALLTLFRRRRGLDQQTFIRRWHDEHSPMALQTHPLWNYLRNVVEEPVTLWAPPWAGIVEEHFRQEADLSDPRRFLGTTALVVPRLAHVAAQTSTFLDLPTLENYILAERWILSPRPEGGERPSP